MCLHWLTLTTLNSVSYDVATCSFMDLTRTLDPNYPAKAEKTVIITDTIKAISSVRAENSCLLEEKDQLQVSHQDQQSKVRTGTL